MHEMSVMINMIEMAEASARAQKAQRIVGISLLIGEMSSVVPEYLEYLFPDVTEGTMLEGAQLHIQRLPVRARCSRCCLVYEWRAAHYRCPDCGSEEAKIVSGREFKVASIEIQEEGEPQ